MNWMLRLYPAPWRERYGEEFDAVLSNQRPSPGLVLDVLAGALDARLHPQVRSQMQHSDSEQVVQNKSGDDTMTLAMLQRCAIGGPKLSPSERRIASGLGIASSLVLAILYLVLTKLYRGAPAVQAVIYTAILFPNFIHQQTVYLKKRLWLTQAFVLGAGVSAMYLFMLAVCLIAARL
jgi:hypothetical protein